MKTVPSNPQLLTATATELGWPENIWPIEFTDKGETFKIMSRQRDDKDHSRFVSVVYQSDKERQLKVYK